MSELEILEKRLADLPPGPEFARDRVDVLNWLCHVHRDLEQWAELLRRCGEALLLARQIGYVAGRAESLCHQAFADYMRSDFSSAISKSLDALQLAVESKSLQAEAYARAVLCLVHWSIGNYEEAVTEGVKSSELLHEVGNSLLEGYLLMSRGGLLQSMGKPRESMTLLHQAHNIFVAKGHIVGQSRSLTFLGTAHRALGDLRQALDCHIESVQLAEQSGLPLHISRSMNDLGTTYRELQLYDAAAACFQRALEIREDRYPSAAVTTLLDIAVLQRMRGDVRAALATAERVLQMAERLELRPKAAQAHQALAELYEAQDEPVKALEHLKSAGQLNDNAAKEQAALRLQTMGLIAKIEAVQKDAEIERLKSVELKQKNDDLARLLGELQQAQTSLVQSQKLASLGRLVAAVTHELNTPVGVLMSAMDNFDYMLTHVYSTDRNLVEATHGELKVLKDSAKRIQKTVARLKAFARLDASAYERIDVLNAVENTIALIEPQIRNRISVERAYEDVPAIYGFGADLNQTVMNLLLNAVDAIGETGVIRVGVRGTDQTIEVSISDTGRGIAADKLAELFEPGFNVRGSRVKASLGIMTSLNVVRRHGGDLVVDSRIGRGSTFTIRLPRTLESPNPALARAN
jgi:signal transduction histidine kinase